MNVGRAEAGELDFIEPAFNITVKGESISHNV